MYGGTCVADSAACVLPGSNRQAISTTPASPLRRPPLATRQPPATPPCACCTNLHLPGDIASAIGQNALQPGQTSLRLPTSQLRPRRSPSEAQSETGQRPDFPPHARPYEPRSRKPRRLARKPNHPPSTHRVLRPKHPCPAPDFLRLTAKASLPITRPLSPTATLLPLHP